MKKNHINLFTPSLFTSSIYKIIYAALFKDYRYIIYWILFSLIMSIFDQHFICCLYWLIDKIVITVIL